MLDRGRVRVGVTLWFLLLAVIALRRPQSAAICLDFEVMAWLVSGAPFVFIAIDLCDTRGQKERMLADALGENARLGPARERGELCAICWERMDDEVARLECGHEFHLDCLLEWWKRDESCPYCRWRADDDLIVKA
jgi:hypothetical protein